MEVVHYLLDYDKLKIIQNEDWFSFSLDSVLLPNFVTLNKKIKKILDLGTGNAPIPLILSTKTNASIFGIEIQEDIYDLAKRSVELNNLNDQITILHEDIKNIDKLFETDSFDVITCNPPYFKYSETSNINKNDHKTIARHEISVNLDDIMKVSRKLLKNNGVVAFIHRSERFIEILETMRKYNIEPKKLRFIYPKVNDNCNMVLIEGKKNGNEGLKILSPLYVHDQDGYTKEVRDMFGKKEVNI